MNILNKKSILLVRIFLGVTALLTVLGTMLRVLNLYLHFDNEIEYYSVGAISPVIMNILFALLPIAALVIALMLPKNAYATSGVERPVAIRIVGALCALLCAVLALLELPFFKAHTPLDPIKFIPFLLFAATAVYFALHVLKERYEAHAVAALAPIALSTYYLAASYLDLTVTLNSPIKTMLHVACISTMLFFVAEARAITDGAKKRFYFFSLCSAVFFTGTVSISTIISLFWGKLNAERYEYLGADLFLLVVFIYLCTRATILFITASKEELAPQSDEELYEPLPDDDNESSYSEPLDELFEVEGEAVPNDENDTPSEE